MISIPLLAVAVSALQSVDLPKQPAAHARSSPESDTAGSPARIDVAFIRTRPADAAPPIGPDEAGLESLGRLVYSRVSIDVEDRPARDVLGELGRALGVNLLVFYSDPTSSSAPVGVDPRRRVSLLLHEANGRGVLEAIAAQLGPEITWQVNRGLIEFGPRETLARQDARRTKVYDVTDLCLEAPYFIHPYSGELDRPSDRLRPKDIVADLVRTVTEQCEPQAFEPTPPPSEQEVEEGSPPPAPTHRIPAAATPNPRSNVNTTATRNLDPDAGPVFVIGRWAQVHVKDKTLVVTAPDFVHRAIDGYPDPPPPRLR